MQFIFEERNLCIEENWILTGKFCQGNHIRRIVGVCRRETSSSSSSIPVEMTWIGCSICPIIGFGEDRRGHWGRRRRIRSADQEGDK